MFDRMMMMIRSNLNQMLSRAEDPERVLNMVIVDMQTQLVAAKKQVVVVIADEKRLQRQAADASAHSQNWERKAMLAVRASDDNLARAALARKAEHDELAQAYGSQWEVQKKSVDTLRFALNGLGQKITEAHRTRHMLIARKRRAEAQHTIANTLAMMSTGNHDGVLQRVEDRVLQLEAEAEAIHELGGGLEPSLEAQFRELEASSVDDALSALKDKMALQSAESEMLSLEAAARN